MYFNELFDETEFFEFINQLNERKALSMQSRRKMAKTAKRTAKKRAKVRKRKEKFRKTGKQLKIKSRIAAKTLLRKKILGGANWNTMSLGARAQIDKRLEKKSKAIEKIAKKLFPKIKKAEKERIQKLRQKTPGQPEKTNEQLLREPEVLDQLVTKFINRGMDKQKAYAIATSILQKKGVLKKGTNEEHGAGDEGTNKLINKYKKETPGELNKKFNKLIKKRKEINDNTQ